MVQAQMRGFGNLLRKLRDGDWKSRKKSLERMTKLGGFASRLDGVAPERLCWPGLAGSDLLPRLVSLLETTPDGAGDLRPLTAEVLGRIGPDAETAVEPLRRSLSSGSSSLCISAARALGRICTYPDPVYSSLLRLSFDSDIAVRVAACEALCDMRYETDGWDQGLMEDFESLSLRGRIHKQLQFAGALISARGYETLALCSLRGSGRGRYQPGADPDECRAFQALLSLCGPAAHVAVPIYIRALTPADYGGKLKWLGVNPIFARRNAIHGLGLVATAVSMFDDSRGRVYSELTDLLQKGLTQIGSSKLLCNLAVDWPDAALFERAAVDSSWHQDLGLNEGSAVIAALTCFVCGSGTAGSAIALGRLRAAPELVVPILSARLRHKASQDDTDSMSRNLEIVSALGYYGANAECAADTIVSFMNHVEVNPLRMFEKVVECVLSLARIGGSVEEPRRAVAQQLERICSLGKFRKGIEGGEVITEWDESLYCRAIRACRLIDLRTDLFLSLVASARTSRLMRIRKEAQKVESLGREASSTRRCRTGSRCITCGKSLLPSDSVQPPSTETGFARSVEWASRLFATTGRVCECGAAICIGCIPLDGEHHCPVCSASL